MLASLIVAACTSGAAPPSSTPPSSTVRAILLESAPGEGAVPIAWPWPSIPLSDFVAPGDPNLPSWPRRVLSADEVMRLGVSPAEGGFSGLWLRAPDRSVRSLTVRPLLPDELE